MKPKPIIPTEPPPPPPARAPEETIPEDEPPPTVPPTQRPTPPPHAPSQRAGGRAKVRRIESPPEGTPVIIDRAGEAPPAPPPPRHALGLDRRAAARAQAGFLWSPASVTVIR